MRLRQVDGTGPGGVVRGSGGAVCADREVLPAEACGQEVAKAFALHENAAGRTRKHPGGVVLPPTFCIVLVEHESEVGDFPEDLVLADW